MLICQQSVKTRASDADSCARRLVLLARLCFLLSLLLPRGVMLINFDLGCNNSNLDRKRRTNLILFFPTDVLLLAASLTVTLLGALPRQGG